MNLWKDHVSIYLKGFFMLYKTYGCTAAYASLYSTLCSTAECNEFMGPCIYSVDSPHHNPNDRRSHSSALMPEPHWLDRTDESLPCHGPGSLRLFSSAPQWSECCHSRLQSGGEESHAAIYIYFVSFLWPWCVCVSFMCAKDGAVNLYLTACNYT